MANADAMNAAQNDIVSDIMDYECGYISEEDVNAFFQRLLDTGTIRHLQGSYQRKAQELIDCGEIHQFEKISLAAAD